VRRVQEPADVIVSVSEAAGVEFTRARHLLTVFRDVVDGLIADDFSVVVWPLLVASASDPVFRLLADRVRVGDVDEAMRQAIATGDDRAVSTWLDVSDVLYRRHPIAGEFTILAAALDRLGDGRDLSSETQEQVFAGLRAWLGTFSGGRRYVCGSVGLERDLEDWLSRTWTCFLASATQSGSRHSSGCWLTAGDRTCCAVSPGRRDAPPPEIGWWSN
jgi:hypothetical protein